MGTAHRQPATDLISDLKDNTKLFSFFRAVSILLDEVGHDIEERELYEQGPKNLYFLVDPSLGFPTSDIETLELVGDDDKPTYMLTTHLLGLHGSSSPLPSYLIESAAWNRLERGVQQSFQDFFSNRLIWLFYLIWRKYRYHIRYRANANDQFSNWMFSLIGLEGKQSRGTSGIPWAKLLTYLGIISARTRSPETVSGVIAHAFDLSHVTIKELEFRKIEIPQDQRSSLGGQNYHLGQDAIIGRYANDIGGKFTIHIHDLDFRRFKDFLPSGADYPKLKELVEFLLKDQLAYDLQLNLKLGETPKFQLGITDFSNLGWTTFVGQSEKSGVESVALQVRA